MSSRSYTKRNRPITACRECHRRKQKCNRLKPCNICLVRNVPQRCIYGSETQELDSLPEQTQPAILPASLPESDISVAQTTELVTDNLDEQIGYSAFSDNAFNDLYKSIDSIHVPNVRVWGFCSAPLQGPLKERYFKIISNIPPTTICETLIDTYFIEADWYFGMLDRYYFQRLFAAWNALALPDESFILLEQYPQDLQHFPALLLQVLAVGLHFSPVGSAVPNALHLRDFAACERQSQIYSDLACEIMTIIGRKIPSISGIEHDMTRTTWLKNVSRGIEARQSMGSAVGQAQDLELHLESDAPRSVDGVSAAPETLWYNEYKRRVWARVFMLDSHIALILGRPRYIHLDDCTAELPTNCDIADDVVNIKPRAPEPHMVPSSFTPVIFYYQISLLIHEVMSAKSKKSYKKDYNKVLKIHAEVDALSESLPPAFRTRNPDPSWDKERPHFPQTRQQLRSTANAFLIKLHRPYIHVNEASRSAVIQASLGVLDAQQKLFESVDTRKNQHRIYAFSFYTVDAAMLLSAVVISRFPSDPVLGREIAQSLRQAINRLGVLKSISAVAASGEKLLTQCYEKIDWPSTDLLPDSGNEVQCYQTDAPTNVSREQIAVGLLQPDFNFLEVFNISSPQNFDFDLISGMLDAEEVWMDRETEAQAVQDWTVNSPPTETAANYNPSPYPPHTEQ